MSGKSLVKVTQTKSSSGRLKSHKACIRGLGLRKIGHTVEVEDTPSVRGMINKVRYMLSVEGE
ncbi:MAG: 50S ribosomal protein L30 [Pseudomonadales bacterium]|nr:50S ribosomal protein L30 [Pseudomonadales bacterium]